MPTTFRCCACGSCARSSIAMACRPAAERRFGNIGVARLLGYTDADLRRIHGELGCAFGAAQMSSGGEAATCNPYHDCVGAQPARLADRLELERCRARHPALHHSSARPWRVQRGAGHVRGADGRLSLATARRMPGPPRGRGPIGARRSRQAVAVSACCRVDHSRRTRSAARSTCCPAWRKPAAASTTTCCRSSARCRSRRRRGWHWTTFLIWQKTSASSSAYLDGAGRARQDGRQRAGPRSARHRQDRVRSCAGPRGRRQAAGNTHGGAERRPAPGRSRFESYRFAQSLLAGSDRRVLLFDEVEDVFSGGPKASMTKTATPVASRAGSTNCWSATPCRPSG